MAHISDIKLIRTDTTLDLSQKAEKGMICLVAGFIIYTTYHAFHDYSVSDVGLLNSYDKTKHSLCLSELANCPESNWKKEGVVHRHMYLIPPAATIVD